MASEGQNVVCVKIQVTGIDWGVISGHTHIPEDTLQDVTPLKFGMGHLRSTHIPEALVFQSFLASPALYKFPGCQWLFFTFLSVSQCAIGTPWNPVRPIRLALQKLS